ncbi:GGDEF domain-containing protein [Butyrivibrio sp. DSM 10294]|uniref:GGDEF domain-containing protein n=1 Tax=Butyrivibrio sp. DSM 10294 TaxID=2972457 RepID=UPI00234E843C|nr:GGDEF domain-containing protein [Butyrivibrio sp. DSM 10294]MDC7293520.1 GGDEF domain-containing protein [Butyrivibrio sp. DSM 10294]
MNKRNVNRRFFMLPIVLFIITLMMVTFGSRIMTESRRFQLNRLDKGWSFSDGEYTTDDVTLSKLRINHTYRGETIILTNTLSKKALISPTLLVISKMAVVEVYIDEEKVYESGREYYDSGLIVPKNYHFIHLKDTTSDHKLKIVLTVCDEDAFTQIEIPYYGTMHGIMKEFMEIHRLPLFVGGFLVIYSWILFSLAVYLILTKRSTPSMFFSSAIAMLLGLYTFTYNDIFYLLGDKDYFYNIMEYMALYMIPLAISVLFYSTHPTVAPRRQLLCLNLNTLFPIAILLINHLKVAPINHFMVPFQAVSTLEILIMLPPLLMGLNSEHKKKLASDTYTGVDADSYMMLGFIILIFFGLLEIGRYHYNRYVSTTVNAYTSINYLTLGMLYFVFCLFIYYFLHGIDSTNSKYVQEQLEGLAFTDTLTGLVNRAKCMQYFASVRVPYAIVSIDLDRLKYVNDTYGHIAGDKMIKDFSELLVKAFPNAAVIGRVGGDEFLVSIENPDANICDDCINFLQELIDEYNQSSQEFKLSASCGYAYSEEDRTGGFESIFILADSRMYEMKEKHHA